MTSSKMASKVVRTPLALGSHDLSLEEVRQVAMQGRKVVLAKGALQKIKKSHAFLQKAVASGNTHYGVNTGFGLLSSVKIPSHQVEELQRNLLRSHATGVGHAMPDEVVAAMLLLRAKSLSLGFSGVRPELVKKLLELLNKKVFPIVPQQESVGASGDLAPLAHLSLVLIGEGFARYQGKVMSGAQALKKAGIRPIDLQAKEGLALINGTQFMTAVGTLALLQAEYLADVADHIAAMTIEALRGTAVAFASEIHAVRPHPGQVLVAKRMRQILKAGKDDRGTSQIAKSHLGCNRVQDPYSLRCVPQVHGASRDALQFVRGVLEKEINSVTDNPLIFPGSNGRSGKILSGGNFHGQVVAIAMDALCIAAAELGNVSEQRLEKMINPAISELPAFLTDQGGLNSGFMIVQVAAASIVSENKTLCHPASVDSIPTSADKEDHVSMGAWAARKAGRVVTNVRRVLAMELLGAAQAVDLLRPLRSTPTLEKMHAQVRKKIQRVIKDRPFHQDIDYLSEMIRKREFHVQ